MVSSTELKTTQTTNVSPNTPLFSSSTSPPSTPPSSSTTSLSSQTTQSYPPPAVILSPCAACKILRRRCVEKCVLAPYFPPTDPLRFTIAHRVFGASNIIKLLQELPESKRADAVSSLVYEANARIRDPVYGCAGAISHLQNQVSELQAELAKTQAELANMHSQQANLLALFCTEQQQQQQQQQQGQILYDINPASLSALDDPYCASATAWETPLWA